MNRYLNVEIDDGKMMGMKVTTEDGQNIPITGFAIHGDVNSRIDHVTLHIKSFLHKLEAMGITNYIIEAIDIPYVKDVPDNGPVCDHCKKNTATYRFKTGIYCTYCLNHELIKPIGG